MVAPRTRAERPAEIVPAARPARRGSRRAAADATDGSPPKPPRTKANGAALNGADPAHAAATPKGTTATATAPRSPKKTSIESLGDQLVASILKHDDDADVSHVRRAIDFAVEAHGEQKRASGEAYVTHPIAAAQILADLGMDPVAIQAALLHDEIGRA